MLIGIICRGNKEFCVSYVMLLVHSSQEKHPVLHDCNLCSFLFDWCCDDIESNESLYLLFLNVLSCLQPAQNLVHSLWHQP